MFNQFVKNKNKYTVCFLFFILTAMMHAEDKWTFPPIDLSEPNQNATSARIISNNLGHSVAVWESYNGHTTIQASYFDGSCWTEPVNLSVPGQNALNPQVCMNDLGHIVVVWQRFDKSNFIIQASHFIDNDWTAPIDLSEKGQNAFNPQICCDNAYHAYAVWRRFNGDNFIIQASRFDSSSWALPTDLSVTGQNAENPQITCDDSGNATALWQKSYGRTFVVQTSHYCCSTWSYPSDLPNEPLSSYSKKSDKNNTFDDYKDTDSALNLAQMDSSETTTSQLASTQSCNTNCSGVYSTIDFRGAYLRPNSSRLRDIYGEAWFDFGIEGNFALSNYFLGWLGLDYTFNYGETLCGNDPTQISIFPLSLGLKAATRYNRIQPYIGVGPKFFWVWIENDSTVLIQKVNFFTVGGVAKIGSHFFIRDTFAFSIFADYSFAKKKFSSNPNSNIIRDNLDLSNVMVGASLGAYF